MLIFNIELTKAYKPYTILTMLGVSRCRWNGVCCQLIWMFCLNFVLASCIDSIFPRINGVQQGWVLPMEKDTIDNII